MSWHYLQGEVEESWEGSCLDGAPDALLKLMPTQEKFYLQDSETESSNRSRSGTTLPHLTESHGEEKLTLSQEDSHVNHFQPRQEVETQRIRFGQKCTELSSPTLTIMLPSGLKLAY